MPSYRLYELDAAGHIVGPPAILDCATDQEAIRQAQEKMDGLAVELWEHSRRIWRSDTKS